MKNMKKILALVVAAMMIVASMSAFAAVDDYKLTINNTVKDHTYTAYQIFKGTKADKSTTDKSLGDVEWGDDITTAGKKALYTAYNMTVADADLDKSANILALMDKIADKDNNTDSESDKAVKVANVFFTTATNGSVTIKDGLLTAPVAKQVKKATGTTTVFDGLASGYYLVNDAYTPATGETLGKDYSIARIAVQVVGDTTINNKADKPTLDKVIDGANEEDATTTTDVKGDTVGIGGKVPYKLTSKVPEMAGYTKYFYIVNDSMTEGLTFNDDVAITIGNKTLTKTTDKTATGENFYVETGVDGTNTTIKIVFCNFLQYNSQVGDAITITYSATVNEKAKVNEEANINTAKLIYSNNPLDDESGEPDTPNEPKPGKVTGETPDVSTDTFATVLKIKKIDGEDPTKTLAGAKFKVTGTKHETALVNQEKFVKADDGTYYMLKDGTYTTKAPVTTEEGYTADQYDSTTQMYKKITTIDKTTVGTSSTFEVEGYVNKSGILTLTGLSEGEYEITELVAPTGYNLLTESIKVALGYTYNAETRKITWSAPAKTSDNKDNAVTYNSTDKCFEISIENNKGTQLPSTGGMGTTILYVGGSILVILAAVLLITKRRMNAND